MAEGARFSEKERPRARERCGWDKVMDYNARPERKKVTREGERKRERERDRERDMCTEAQRDTARERMGRVGTGWHV